MSAKICNTIVLLKSSRQGRKFPHVQFCHFLDRLTPIWWGKVIVAIFVGESLTDFLGVVGGPQNHRVILRPTPHILVNAGSRSRWGDGFLIAFVALSRPTVSKISIQTVLWHAIGPETLFWDRCNTSKKLRFSSFVHDQK